ncbi:ATP-binding protein [Polyangium aurulentum]|uniref:ATP-binding protein n=1 Tax=Polyangium aurulentum TaxID=2567896 RepID=UPI0010AE3AC7|nr:ATP-binding protein [Polyangium aurulentum]UQA60734.1 HAMP domain-containing protein [Polyangium aurulentum]
MKNLFVRFYVGVVAAIALAVVLILAAAARRGGPEDATPAELERDAARKADYYLEVTQGYHWLARESLLAQPPEQWDAVVERWQPHFRYPLSIQRTSEVLVPELPAFARRRIEAGELAAWPQTSSVTGEHVKLYLPLAGSDRVLVQQIDIGPTLEALLELVGLDLVFFLVVLGAAILALTRPLVRHVTRLAEATSAFGAGQLDARASTAAPEPVAHLARTFNAMAERIQRAADEQQATLQAISHELRTPITRLQFALEAAGGALGAEAAARAQLDEMAKDVGEIEALVEELLTYARLQPGAPPVERVAIDLADMVDGVVGELAPLSPDLSIEVDAPDPAVCTGDPKHLRRAVSNLLRNAQRHARARIRVRLAVTESSCTVIVDDDGPGIPPEGRERVFLPFERLDASRNRATGGHGLGLAIVHRVMQAHGGSARAADGDLGGARLILSWPRLAEAPPLR